MDDLISRQAVQKMVDRIGGMYPYRQIGNRDSYSQYNEAWTDAINRVDAELNSLPSAQSTMGQVFDDDCVSRQAAIDAMKDVLLDEELDYAIPTLERLPSAQPQYEELTPEEAASEIASGSIFSASYWLDVMIALKQMGYAICREKG